MTKLALILLIIFLINFKANAIENDKAAHFVVSSMISQGTYTWLDKDAHSCPKCTAFAIAFAIGATKELAFDDKPSGGDMVANTLGALTPLLLTWEF